MPKKEPNRKAVLMSCVETEGCKILREMSEAREGLWHCEELRNLIFTILPRKVIVLIYLFRNQIILIILLKTMKISSFFRIRKSC